MDVARNVKARYLNHVYTEDCTVVVNRKWLLQNFQDRLASPGSRIETFANRLRETNVKVTHAVWN